MSKINIDLAADTILNVMIGQQDENEVREVVFDFSGWYTTYGSGTISLAIQRPKDEWPYEGTLTVDSTNHKATWDISETDTAYAGTGQIQLSYKVGDAKKKSVVYRFTCHKSLGALGSVVTPVQIQTFIDEVEEALQTMDGKLDDMEDEIADVKADLAELQSEAGVTAELKLALLQLASKVAYIDADGSDYYQDLYDALYPNASSISCVYTQTGTVYTTDNLDSLKDDLVVTAHYSDSTTRVLLPSDYTLTGTLTVGTSIITVHYGTLNATFNVTVTERTLSSISAVYTQGGTVTDVDSLDSLRTDLVVTAHYSDSGTETVTTYTLSGTLAVGTSTITVSYEGKTTTFTVTVTEYLTTIEYEKGALSKPTLGTNLNKIFPATTTQARARMVAPVHNAGYTFTVTDSTKYNLCAYDPITDVPETITEMGVQYQAYQGGTKSIAWKTSDSVETSYIWVSFKKMDNTNFTDEELANMCGTVFTVTKS